MSASTLEPPSPTTSDFVKTHCRICAAGQTITRIKDDGQEYQATYCLMLRDWMTDPNGKPFITACDRFEQK